MTANRLHPSDNVLVELYLEGNKVDSYEGSGFHNIEQAVEKALHSIKSAKKDVEDYVFRVTDLADNTSARYRVNAGGNLKLIPDEL